MMLSADGGIPIMFNNRNYCASSLAASTSQSFSFLCGFGRTNDQKNPPKRFKRLITRCPWKVLLKYEKKRHYCTAVKCVGPQAYCSSQGQCGSVIKPALLAPPKEPAKPLRPSLSPSIIMNIFQPGDRNFP